MKKKTLKLKNLKEFVETYKILKPHPKNNMLLSKEGIEDLTTDGACLRPDIYLDNGRHCDGCHYIEHCKCAIKKPSSKIKYIDRRKI